MYCNMCKCQSIRYLLFALYASGVCVSFILETASGTIHKCSIITGTLAGPPPTNPTLLGVIATNQTVVNRQ